MAGRTCQPPEGWDPYIDSVAITPVRDQRGAITAFMSIQRDVTHLRDVEGDLRLEARSRTFLLEAREQTETTVTLEEAAQVVCDGIGSLPGIDFVLLVAVLNGNAVVVAAQAPSPFPFAPGDALPPRAAAYLRTRADEGPWGLPPGQIGSGHLEAAIRAAGAQALAFGPIRHGDHTGGVLVVGTRDAGYADLVARTEPARSRSSRAR